MRIAQAQPQHICLEDGLSRARAPAARPPHAATPQVLLGLVVVADGGQARRASHPQGRIGEVRIGAIRGGQDVDTPWGRAGFQHHVLEGGPHAGARTVMPAGRLKQGQQGGFEGPFDGGGPAVHGRAGPGRLQQGEMQHLPHDVPARGFDGEQRAEQQRQRGNGEAGHGCAALAGNGMRKEEHPASLRCRA